MSVLGAQRGVVTQPRVVRSEWTELWSLRSTWVTLGTAAVITVGMATAFGFAHRSAVRSGEEAAGAAQAVDVTFLGLDRLGLVLGVFGVLQATGEHGSGLIRASLTAVPRRCPLLVGKAVVLIAVVTPLGLVVCLVSFVVVQNVLGDDAVALTDDGVAPAVLGAAAYPLAATLLGLGVGTGFRHTAGAITMFAAAFLVIPAALSQSVEDATLKYTPVAAAQSLYAVTTDGGPIELLGPAAGAVVLAAWVAVAVALAAGGAVLVRRDA
ncbi:ABC transporter permease [Cryptosporangium minutisporangium]|uniref:ABC transporter permease n=1 Tax=Cryptosporangium minutisporangium TaxID=113569 RepID=A0ABP6ST98_9ACTN